MFSEDLEKLYDKVKMTADNDDETDLEEESIKIDMEKSEIVCNLPIFGEEEPLHELGEDGQLKSIGGKKLHPQLESLEVLIQNQLFSRKLRGRLVDDSKVFEGSMVEQLEDFDSLPKKLTRKIIFDKSSMFRKFWKNCQSSRMPMKILDTSLKFQMFFANENGQSCIFLVLKKSATYDDYNFSNDMGVKKPGIQYRGKHAVDLNDEVIPWSLGYLFRKGSKKIYKSYSLKRKQESCLLSVESSTVRDSKLLIAEFQRFLILSQSLKSSCWDQSSPTV